MNLKQLFDDDSAVSPVIGVILMVAITVILAAVIGAFVLNLGGSQDAAPTATWQWNDVQNGTELTMKSGTDVQAEEIYVSVNNTEWKLSENGFDGNLGAGDSVCISYGTDDNLTDADCPDGHTTPTSEQSVVWKSSNTDSSTVLDSHTAS